MSFQLASAFSADRVAEIYSDTGGVVRAVSRRVVLSSIAALALAFSSNSGSPEELNVEADQGGIDVTRYAAYRVGKRPAVLVLHGNRGVEFSTRAYERYANALAAGGIDAYLVHYFTAEDHQALDPKKSARESRDAYTTSRFEGWTARISSVVAAILERPDSSGRIGLLGFSLGGYIAADTAAHDQRVTAIAVLYGGMPDAMVTQVKHLPPLIELHGDADRAVPLAKGEELVKLARAVGAPAEQVTYPGREHGFDFSDSDPMTVDVVGRVVRFFQAHLLGL
jgi:carboxymethylenebutenolidase